MGAPVFQTTLTADLPSTEVPGAAPGDDAFAQTHDELSFGTVQLLDLLRRGLAEAGIRDVAWIQVDGAVVYEDRAQVDEQEIDDLLHKAAAAGFLTQSFTTITMALEDHDDHQRHAVLVTASTQVPAGEPEVRIQLGSRPHELVPQDGESGPAFLDRLRSIAKSETPLVAHMARVQSRRDQIAQALRDVFHPAPVEAGDVNLVLVRPGRDELLSLNALPFGASRLPVRFELAPGGRWPYYDDPFLQLYDDPYLVSRHLALLDALMLDGALRHPWVHVTQPDGKTLFDGTKASWFESWPWRTNFAVEADGTGLAVRFTT